MNRPVAFLIIVSAAFFAVASMFSQSRPYTQVMKDIGPTFASLKKNLDSNAADAVVQDAEKLEGLFKETEAFWSQFNTKDAVDHAKNAQKAFAEISAKAKSNDI